MPERTGSIAGIVLAAGMSTRMGQNKLFMELEGETLVRRAVSRVRNAGVNPLVVVLGHERCGAVAATQGCVRTGGKAPGHIQSVVEALTPIVGPYANGADAVEQGVQANVRAQVAAVLAQSAIIREKVGAGHMKVVGARYDLDTGKVTVIASCAGDVHSIKIDPSVVDPSDVEFLEDLVLKGVQEAVNKGKETAAAEMKKLTGGLGIPGL